MFYSVLLQLFLMTGNPTLPASDTGAPFELVEGLIFMKGKVNGIGGYFILDNGAPGLVLNSAMLKDRDSMLRSSLKGLGATGESQVFMYRVREFTCNKWQVKDMEVPVMDLSHIAMKVKKDFLGLVGYEQLKGQAIGFDYERRKVIVNDDAAGKNVEIERRLVFRDSLEMQLHLPVLTVKILGKNYRMGVDCGAGANLLPDTEYRLLSGICRDQKSDTLAGAGGLQKIFNCLLTNNRLGDIDLKPMRTIFSAATIESMRASNIMIDGIAGYELLKQYYTVIDFKHCKISFYRL